MKDLIEIKKEKGIISKIINFIKRILGKKPKENNDKSNIIVKKDELKNNLKNDEIQEKLRLIELQNKFKKGEIFEEDIDDEDYEKLLELYDEQNNKIKQEINTYKEETKIILNELKG